MFQTMNIDFKIIQFCTDQTEYSMDENSFAIIKFTKHWSN